MNSALDADAIPLSQRGIARQGTCTKQHTVDGDVCPSPADGQIANPVCLGCVLPLYLTVDQFFFGGIGGGSGRGWGWGGGRAGGGVGVGVMVVKELRLPE